MREFDEGRYDLAQRKLMDRMDVESEQRARDRDAEIDAKAEAEALADIYATPVSNAIRAIPASRFNVLVVKQIILSLASKVTTSDWGNSDEGELIFGVLVDLEGDLPS